jgi:uncharacterized protein YeaO (DUF488 family)
MIKTKSVFTKIGPTDGLRVLVARGRGRGLPASRFDVWMASLGPSEDLRDRFRSDKITWDEFSKRYAQELRESSSSDAANKKTKNHGQKFTLRLLQHIGQRQNVTLLCHCAQDETNCHRHVLQAILDRPIK